MLIFCRSLIPLGLAINAIVQGAAAEVASGQASAVGAPISTVPSPASPDDGNVDAQLYEITMRSVGVDPVTGARITVVPATLLNAVKRLQTQITDPHGPSAERARALIIILQNQAGESAAADSSCRAVFTDPTSSKFLRSNLISTYFTICQQQSRCDELDRLAKEAAGLQMAPGYVAYLAKAAAAEHLLTIGRPLPDFDLTDIQGVVHHLADYRGKVLLIDFWATWCVSCVRDMPQRVKDYASFHNRGLEMLGVSLDQDRGKLDAFLHQHPAPWPQICDTMGWGNDFRKRSGVTAIPDTLLIAPDGTLVRKHLTAAALSTAIEQLLPKVPVAH